MVKGHPIEAATGQQRGLARVVEEVQAETQESCIDVL